MRMSFWVALGLFGVLASASLTAGVLRWARRVALDVPNERSLHTVPTPRGGGIAIAATQLGLLPVLFAALPEAEVGSPVLAGWLCVLLLASLGLVDDLRPLPAKYRLLAQLVIFGLFLGAAVFGFDKPLLIGGVVLGALAMTWLVNLYNFMDGSDGLAATQAILTGTIGGILACLQGDELVGGWALIIAAASAGFLMWNKAPARIFMGDAGSYCLGAGFAVLIALSGARGLPPWPFLILLAPFIVDATLTLLRRMFAGEVWYAAHRTHAYQRLVQSGRGHAWVARACALDGVLVGAPLAWLASVRPALGLVCFGLAGLLHAAVWWRITSRLGVTA
jgi:Fuc2NAc and GlcNAc transferase